MSDAAATLDSTTAANIADPEPTATSGANTLVSSELPSNAPFIPPTADDITHASQFSEEPPRQTAASLMKQKVRDVLDAQPFRGKAVHKDDLIAVIDALIDGPDNDGPEY